MAFKLKKLLGLNNTSVYYTNMPDDTFGLTLNNGTVLVNNKLSDKDKKKTIKHEEVHVDQIKRGDLDYTDSAVYWKNKKYPRSKMKEGAKNLPWEKEAYKKTK